MAISMRRLGTQMTQHPFYSGGLNSLVVHIPLMAIKVEKPKTTKK
jgi:hypothetical protein